MWPATPAAFLALTEKGPVRFAFHILQSLPEEQSYHNNNDLKSEDYWTVSDPETFQSHGDLIERFDQLVVEEQESAASRPEDEVLIDNFENVKNRHIDLARVYTLYHQESRVLKLRFVIKAYYVWPGLEKGPPATSFYRIPHFFQLAGRMKLPGLTSNPSGAFYFRAYEYAAAFKPEHFIDKGFLPEETVKRLLSDGRVRSRGEEREFDIDEAPPALSANDMGTVIRHMESTFHYTAEPDPDTTGAHSFAKPDKDVAMDLYIRVIEGDLDLTYKNLSEESIDNGYFLLAKDPESLQTKQFRDQIQNAGSLTPPRPVRTGTPPIKVSSLV
ncbi:hypothetical protein BJ508DRAFT_350057 [Ascobolus immersus RN42]|uniref:Uncharacterized protein n=1 Tax=Ascobolus immersus RN42 TaxID=1160509 RepID=A0A3N4HZ35_ASCIM|nr:hypothetical protein BJ508DRAFT_350057 [Ascobolus immersus RN42]